MATRTISGTIPTFPGATIRFRQLAAFLTDDATYLAKSYIAQANTAGAFSIALPVPDAGSTRYRIQLPNGTAVELALGIGDPLTLESILGGG